MTTKLTREQGLELLKKYNKEPFHILHGLTVEGTMRWFANELGYKEDADFWAMAGLLHDIDFEMYPEQHCIKAEELLREAGAEEELIHAICSHGYGIACDVKPEHEMEKVLFAADELTGLVGAAARMLSFPKCNGNEASALKRNLKIKSLLPWSSGTCDPSRCRKPWLDAGRIMEKTILAQRSCEESINKEMEG